MRILMLSAYFPPEVGSASHLFYELGTELVRRGHRVTVLTGYPTYNVDVKKLPSHYRAGWWMRESVNGMKVVRVRTPGMPRHIPVLRGIGQFTLSLALSFSGMFLAAEDAEIILVYSPPLFLGLTALLLRRLKKSRAVLNVQDLFPQSAIDLGLLQNPLLIKLFRRVETLLYRRSDAVTVHSAGNRDHVVKSGGDSRRTFVVPNLVDTKSIRPAERNNAFRHRFNIDENEYVVSFAGVIGLSQDVDTVIEAARLLSDEQRVVFYIVGDGLEKARLMERAKNMRNVRFIPMLSKEEYAQLLHASDMCLATLRKEVRTPVVPSKILSIMAAGRPVVASLPLEGDAPILIGAADCGICVEPESPDKLSAAILSLLKDQALADLYGRNGRKYVEAHSSAEACASQYENIFELLLRKAN